MDYGLWIMDYGLWIMVYGLWFMDYGLWIMADTNILRNVATDSPSHYPLSIINYQLSIYFRPIRTPETFQALK